MIGGIGKCRAKFLDRCVKAVVKLNECVCGPKPLPNFFPGNDLAGLFEQHLKDFEWLVLQSNPNSAFSEHAAVKIGLEHTKPRDIWRFLLAAFHRVRPGTRNGRILTCRSRDRRRLLTLC